MRKPIKILGTLCMILLMMNLCLALDLTPIVKPDKIKELKTISEGTIKYDYTDEKTDETLDIATDYEIYNKGLSSTEGNIVIDAPKKQKAYILFYTDDTNLKWLKEYSLVTKKVKNITGYKCLEPDKINKSLCLKEEPIFEMVDKDYDVWTKLYMESNFIKTTDLLVRKNTFGVAQKIIKVDLEQGENYYKFFIDINQNSKSRFDFEVIGFEDNTKITVDHIITKDYGYIDPISTTNWSYYAQVNLTGSLINGNNNNFPVLITEAGLPSEIFSNAKSDGCDIRFSIDSLGIHEIPLELVNFNTTTNKTEIWVKTNLTASTNKVIYVWYGYADASCYSPSNTFGAENVWREEYKLVYHMNQNPTGIILDSTSNSHDGTGTNFPSNALVNGYIGNAIEFEGTNDYILVSDSDDWYWDGNFSTQVLFESDSWSGYPSFFSQEGGSYFSRDLIGSLSGEGSVFQFDNGPKLIDVRTNRAGWFDNIWYFKTLTRNGNDYNIYRDSVSLTNPTNSVSHVNIVSDLHIGHTFGFQYYNGIMDEYRLVKGLGFSHNWILTEYNNQNNVSAFLTAGAQQSFNDLENPSYSNANHSNSQINAVSLFTLDVNDNAALQPSGQYIFSFDNCVGTFTNDSAVNFTSTPQSITTPKTLASTTGCTVRYQWFLSDNTNNTNQTPIYSFVTTEYIPLLKRLFTYVNATGVQNVFGFYEDLKVRFFGDVEVDGDAWFDGKIGIGTTSPDGKLQVVGDEIIFGADISTENDLLQLYQTSDFNGIHIAGYDDLNETYIKLNIGNSKVGRFDASDNFEVRSIDGYILFQAKKQIYFKSTDNKDFIFRDKNNNNIMNIDTSTQRVGIGVNTPTSLLDVNGSFALPITTKTADYTADATDYTILADATSNTVTITLPTAVGITGRIYNIKCIDATYTVTVDANGTETIDGELTQILVVWDNMKIQSTGTGWIII